MQFLRRAALPINGILVAIAVVLASIAITWNEYHSASSDAGLHYGLVRNLMDHAEGQANVPSIPFMSDYPPLAHWIAAQIGRLSGSGLQGMTATASASVALFYLAMFIIVSRISWRAVVLSLSIVVIYAILRGPVFGRMVVSNYFFAQVAASAFIPVALLGTTYLQDRKYWISADILAIACVQVLVFTHLLPALQLAAIYCLILAVDFYRSRNWWLLVRLLIFSWITIALALKNPFIWTMYEASQYEASAHINHFNNRALQVLLAVAGLYLSSRLLLAVWGNRYAISLSCFGLGTSTITLLVVLAHAAGLTTSYTISKTVFMTVTSVIFVGASLIAQRRGRLQDTGSMALSGLPSAALCGGLALLAMRVDLYPSEAALQPIVTFQQGVRSALAKIKSDRQQAIVLASTWPKNIAFAIVYGDLRVQLDPATRTLTGQDFPTDRFTIAFAPLFDPLIRKQCIDHTLSDDRAVAMRYDCLLGFKPNDLLPDESR